MAVLRVVDVRVDSSLKNAVEVLWLSGRLGGPLRQLDVQKGRDVTQVEDAGISELDWLIQKLLIGKHATGDGVPGIPESLPVLQSRDG